MDSLVAPLACFHLPSSALSVHQPVVSPQRQLADFHCCLVLAWTLNLNLYMKTKTLNPSEISILYLSHNGLYVEMNDTSASEK